MNTLTQINRKFELSITTSHITSKSGLALVHEQACAFDLPLLIKKYLPRPGSNRGYDSADFLFPIMLSLAGGGRSFEDIREIRLDHALRKLCGMNHVPESDTISQWVRKEEVLSGLKKINNAVRKRILKKLDNKKFTVETDATLIKSDKKSAEKTYKGFSGFSVMYSFLAENGLCVANDFRTGNISPSTGILEQLQEVKAMLDGCDKEVDSFRSDSAAYQSKILDYCEDEGITYYISADLDKSVQRMIRRIPAENWEELGEGKECTEKEHAMNKGNHGFTLVIKREKIRKKFEEIYEELILFPNYGDYFYHIVASNELEMSKKEIINEYNQRGNAENMIKETKYGFGLDYCPSQDFIGNASWHEIGILAYNIITAMKLFVFGSEFKNSQVSTLRWRIFLTAGKVIAHAKKLILKIHEWYADIFKKARDNIAKCLITRS